MKENKEKWRTVIFKDLKYPDYQVSNLGNVKSFKGKKERILTHSKDGYGYHTQSNKWSARIGINGKIKHLGLFKDEYEAHLAYQKALKDLEGNVFDDIMQMDCSYL